MTEPIKKRWITLVFPKDLTRKQEDILIINLQAVRAGTQDELRKISDKLQKQRFEHLQHIPVLREAIQFMRARAAALARGSGDEFFSLGNSNKHTYHFGYAYNELKAINAKVNLLGRTLNLPAPSLINENSVVDGLRKYVLPDMGFSKDEVTIKVSDISPEEEEENK
jgi:hypothetical protein